MDLLQKSCQPLPKGSPALDAQAIDRLLPRIPDWQLTPDGKSLQREFSFKNFHQTMAFVNALAWVAHTEDHHPDLQVGYNRCQVNFSTHSIGGLSNNDFICAAKVSALLKADPTR